MVNLRPKVFISSTIYDFRDLRSALKFWLEELGYDVLLSEQNDFPVQVDLNSYESCLRAIDEADYFIVLVGSRVGGWYDQKLRISITQAEYRRAYDRLKVGNIKVLAFVRREVWDIREDRKELERLFASEALHSAELGDHEIRKITTHPTKFVNDAEFVFSFLDEVARLEEMKAAITGDGPLPRGNWIRQFSGFREIIDSLRVELRFGNNLRRVALTANLQAEIMANLLHLVDRGESDKTGTLSPKSDWATFARQSISGGHRDESTMKGKYLKWLGIFALVGCGLGRRLQTDALNEAIVSGELLDFDMNNNAFVSGPMQDAMLQLKGNIQLLRFREELMDSDARYELVSKCRDCENDEEHSIVNAAIVPILGVHDCLFNVISLSRAIYRAVSGDLSLLSNIQIFDDSPLRNESEQMKKERPTPEMIEKWIWQ